MTEPIIVYLDDHLAGSAIAIESWKFRDDTELGAWSLALLKEIEADRRILTDCGCESTELPIS